MSQKIVRKLQTEFDKNLKAIDDVSPARTLLLKLCCISFPILI